MAPKPDAKRPEQANEQLGEIAEIFRHSAWRNFASDSQVIFRPRLWRIHSTSRPARAVIRPTDDSEKPR